MVGAAVLSVLDEMIVGFVEKFIDREGMSPTYADIASALERPYTTVVNRVQALVGLEYLRQDYNRHRSIRPGPRLRG